MCDNDQNQNDENNDNNKILTEGSVTETLEAAEGAALNNETQEMQVVSGEALIADPNAPVTQGAYSAAMVGMGGKLDEALEGINTIQKQQDFGAPSSLGDHWDDYRQVAPWKAAMKKGVGWRVFAGFLVGLVAFAAMFSRNETGGLETLWGFNGLIAKTGAVWLGFIILSILFSGVNLAFRKLTFAVGGVDKNQEGHKLIMFLSFAMGILAIVTSGGIVWSLKPLLIEGGAAVPGFEPIMKYVGIWSSLKAYPHVPFLFMALLVVTWVLSLRVAIAAHLEGWDASLRAFALTLISIVPAINVFFQTLKEVTGGETPTGGMLLIPLVITGICFMQFPVFFVLMAESKRKENPKKQLPKNL